MEGDELDLFERSLRQATSTHTGAGLDAALAELGWGDALGFETRSAVSLLFELQGADRVRSSALDEVLVSGLDLHVGAPAGVVLPPLGDWNPPGRVDGGHTVVRGLATATTAERASLVVIAAGDETVGSVVPRESLTIRPLQGIDPDYGLVEVTGDLDEDPGEPADWGRAAALAQLALAHELVGASRKMLELARRHSLDRVQFGRPISRFQAIRHRLAETLIAIETAAAITDVAWLDGTPESAASAKAVAGRSARTAARHCQQVLAGIGFTTEHPFHLYLRRVLVLDQLLGSSRALTRALGEQVVASRRLPPLLPL